MTSLRWYALVRVAFAGLGLTAVGFQFHGAVRDPEKTIADFLSEFTTQSNVAAALVLLIGASFIWSGYQAGHRWDLLRGAMVTYMATTGIVFRFLVEGTRDTGGPSYYYDWASDILHQVMPIALLVDWLIMSPRIRITVRQTLIWPLYPIAFCAYSLIRGPIVDWYPYDFIDPDEQGGYGGVAVYVVAITIGFLAFSLLVMAIGNMLRQWRSARVATVPVPV
jgi:hypothetical protein